MTDIRTLNEYQFGTLLGDFVRPAKAVTSAQHLHGRAEALKRIRRALRSDGSQAFIFGERGVGKTSLAKTALAELCPQHASNLLIACEPGSTFVSLMTAATKRLLPICRSSAKQTEIKAAFQAFGFSVEASKIWEAPDQIDVADINSFISFIKAIDRLLPQQIAIILDEFDLLADSREKAKFADFVKQLSDQEVRLKFIFCGISTDIDSLIGAHYSAGRYIDPIELGPLKIGAIFAIFEQACSAFNVELDKEVLIRAGLISDGYPYFMHLIALHSLELLYEQPALPSKIDAPIFEEAVRRSVARAEPMLQSAYDVATKKYNDEYQQVLWAASAPILFENKWEDIYERAYGPIVWPVVKGEELTKEKFYKRIYNLTRDEHGSILSTNKNGWYKFSENVIRSYVRLRASEAGVELGIDLHGHSSRFRPEAGALPDRATITPGAAFEPTLPLNTPQPQRGET